jgi:predicted CoA-binding protein
MDNNFFTGIKTIAIIGLSDDPKKHSNKVAVYLQSKGFRIIPVNPNLSEVLGEKVYSNLQAIPAEIKIDVVDIFRRPEEVIVHLKEVLERDELIKVWLQEGVGSIEAEAFARENNLSLVSNFCMMYAHQQKLS